MPQNLGKVKEMISMVKTAGNPQAMLSQMASSNPQMKMILDMVQKSGGDPQKLFYVECQKMGVNPQDILGLLK